MVTERARNIWEEKKGIVSKFAHLLETYIEVGSTAHDLIVLSQKFLVAGEKIVLPEMCGEPSSAVGPHAESGIVHRTARTP